MYVMGNVASMYLALRAMTGTTLIAMFAPGKALRGPDGSMHETVDGMLTLTLTLTLNPNP